MRCIITTLNKELLELKTLKGIEACHNEFDIEETLKELRQVVVEYKRVEHEKIDEFLSETSVQPTEYIPIHPYQIEWALKNIGKEVEFEIERRYVEPPENIHCNRRGEEEIAKLILPIESPKLYRQSI